MDITKTPIDHVIEVLEAARKERLTKALETPAQGFSMAISIVRALNKVMDINDHGDRLIEAFEQYAARQGKQYRRCNVVKCSACGQAHGDTDMLEILDDSIRYWYLCPALLTPAFHFPD